MDNAKAWALRCHLELQQHPSAVFTTLTYDDQHLPATLERRHLQLWLKRLRKRAKRRLRFFACGEYGERTNRPHYHAIVYGLNHHDAQLVDNTWGQGLTKTVPATPASIAYTAGYTAKKLNWRLERGERIDYETGEIYDWEPPFTQMSRRPGIGGEARKWTNSWRLFAIHNGKKMKVPRFLHESWKAVANNEQLEELLYEKQQHALNRDAVTKESLAAAEQIAVAQQALKAQRRKL